MPTIDELKKKYSTISKHSGYQILASNLQKFFPINDIEVLSRFEDERLCYILDNISIKKKHILEIGGNTGFFTFEFINNGASSVEYFEGNKEHAVFVKLASELLKYEKKIQINNNYFNFDYSFNKRYSITLLLNVLHHVGDDYGDSNLIKKKVLEHIINSLKFMAMYTEIIVFQIGFNWKGNKHLPLFKNGTKKEVIDFISNNVKDEYEIIKIGVAEKYNDTIIYKDINSTNIKRDNSLGEFLNRPIFIMKSKLF